MFPLFETIRIEDGRALYIHWHQERINRSYNYLFQKQDAPSLQSLLKVPYDYSSGLVKCRFLYNRSAHTFEFSYYQPRYIRKLKLVNGDHISYELKFTDRHTLDKLNQLRGDCHDILIVKNGKVTDTTYTNIAFSKGEEWFTPDEPLLAGTCRQRLLEEGKIREAIIAVEDLSGYVSFKLMNAMLDFDSQLPLETENIVF